MTIEASRQATSTAIPIFHKVGIGGKTRLVCGMKTPEKVADGVWLLRGGYRGSMNIYFLEDGDGVVQFDGGTRSMRKAALAAGERLGGVKRVVLGHAHVDHRATAPFMGAPVFCHANEVTDAESSAAFSPYMDLSKFPIVPVRWVYSFLFRWWNSGPVKIDGTISEGDEVAGFRVIHFPGHAPGLIGLWRESDRLALVSDVVYLVDSARLKQLPEGEASVPHPAFNMDHEGAKESVRKLAALEPRVVCTGHDMPLRGENLRETLERAAERL